MSFFKQKTISKIIVRSAVALGVLALGVNGVYSADPVSVKTDYKPVTMESLPAATTPAPIENLTPGTTTSQANTGNDSSVN